MKKLFLIFAIGAFFATACNQGSKTEGTETETTTTEAPAAESNIAEVAISGGDDMKFDLSEIVVKEGQTVKLTLTHSGVAPITAMGHNFVLLAAGANLDEFAKAAIDAKDNDYIPKALEKEVIAHTKTIGGGETADIEFTAPAKGTYEFLCSFPGHSAMMKGSFIVE